jgi:PPM family protein phosphatase
LEVEIVALSRQGGRSYNEDVFGHWNDGHFVACLVADGAGGHGGGDVASATVRSSVLDAFSRSPTIDTGVLRALIEQANLAVVARQSESSALSAMRTTVVLVAIDIERNEMAWAHCGDSRAYLFRRGTIIARTKDHSLVQQLVISGMLDDEGARLHPTRNVLLAALGSVDEPLDVAICGPMTLQQGDVVLICSDGLWEPLGDALLAETLRASPSPSTWLELLEQKVKAMAKPGHDNYTALTLWAHDGDVLTHLMTPSPPGHSPE